MKRGLCFKNSFEKALKKLSIFIEGLPVAYRRPFQLHPILAKWKAQEHSGTDPNVHAVIAGHFLHNALHESGFPLVLQRFRHKALNIFIDTSIDTNIIDADIINPHMRCRSFPPCRLSPVGPAVIL